MFGNSSTGGSPFAGNEKYSDSPNGGGNGYGSMAAAGAGVAGGWGAAQQYNSHQQPQQTRQASPTWDSPAAYPAMNAAPASTANLLSNGQQLSHNEIESREMQQHLDNMRQQQQSTFNKPTGATASAPKGLGMMDAGLAGAAGIGAVKIAQQQQQQPEASSPFGDHPGQGTIHVVKRTFEPSLDDELILFVRSALFDEDRAPSRPVLSPHPLHSPETACKCSSSTTTDGLSVSTSTRTATLPPRGEFRFSLFVSLAVELTPFFYRRVFPFDCLGEVIPSGASAPAPAIVPPQPQQPQQPLHTITEAESRSASPTAAPAAQQQPEEREGDGLGYLAYDNEESEQPPAHQSTASSHSSITSQLPPQLPNLRSDSPIDFSSPPSSATTPAAAPLSAAASEFTMPSIQISDPSGEDTTSTAATDYFGEPQQAEEGVPKSLQAGGGGRVEGVKNREGEKSKRTSSLIASRDADLFVALGEVLGREDVKA